VVNLWDTWCAAVARPTRGISELRPVDSLDLRSTRLWLSSMISRSAYTRSRHPTPLTLLTLHVQQPRDTLHTAQPGSHSANTCIITVCNIQYFGNSYTTVSRTLEYSDEVPDSSLGTTSPDHQAVSPKCLLNTTCYSARKKKTSSSCLPV